jgi:hypothetical protein
MSLPNASFLYDSESVRVVCSDHLENIVINESALHVPSYLLVSAHQVAPNLCLRWPCSAIPVLCSYFCLHEAFHVLELFGCACC